MTSNWNLCYHRNVHNHTSLFISILNQAAAECIKYREGSPSVLYIVPRWLHLSLFLSFSPFLFLSPCLFLPFFTFACLCPSLLVSLPFFFLFLSLLFCPSIYSTIPWSMFLYSRTLFLSDFKYALPLRVDSNFDVFALFVHATLFSVFVISVIEVCFLFFISSLSPNFSTKFTFYCGYFFCLFPLTLLSNPLFLTISFFFAPTLISSLLSTFRS